MSGPLGHFCLIEAADIWTEGHNRSKAINQNDNVSGDFEHFQVSKGSAACLSFYQSVSVTQCHSQ